MNVYDDFFAGMTWEEWEFFAADVLFSLGFEVLIGPARGSDGGRDMLVARNGRTYLVSCKHKHAAGKAVGVSDEQSIGDRLRRHRAGGFIGFYSTVISTSLQDVLNSPATEGFEVKIFDKSAISDLLPQLDSTILQKYGLPGSFSQWSNVTPETYAPLPCQKCGFDILNRAKVHDAIAALEVNRSGELEYQYGCKQCISGGSLLGSIDVYHSLHPHAFNDWIKHVEMVQSEHTLSSEFFKTRIQYESGIQQRLFPSNWGRWYGL
ncbi:restriction endonuclease [uncultured Sphingomonas sp.]|uniref:restriction endonuclease n=1 Tax=uncultured Sphingomonas sp. TaxID=158754 RepID=UPI0025DBD786|nr:restriction endonuclease [uncultured Sphingomonas sp.]